MFQMFNHGTITSMLFILVGVIYDRAHTRGVDEFGGLASVMPRYAAFFGFAFMASLGLPGLSGFISEVLVFIGAFKTFTFLVILAIAGVVITAAYHLWAIQRMHLGPFNEKWRGVLAGNDLNFREAADPGSPGDHRPGAGLLPDAAFRPDQHRDAGSGARWSTRSAPPPWPWCPRDASGIAFHGCPWHRVFRSSTCSVI